MKKIIIPLIFIIVCFSIIFSYYFLYLNKIVIYNLSNIEFYGISAKDSKSIEIYGITPLNKQIPIILKEDKHVIYGSFKNIEIVIPEKIESKITFIGIVLNNNYYIINTNDLKKISSGNKFHRYAFPAKLISKGSFFEKVSLAFPLNVFFVIYHIIQKMFNLLFKILFIVLCIIIIFFIILLLSKIFVLLSGINKHQKGSNKILYIIYFIFIFILSDFIIGTIYFHYYPEPHILRIQHPYYHHSLRPMMNGVLDEWNNSHLVYTNSLGFKDFYPRKIQSQTSKSRILFMGDSFTEGVGYPVEKTFYGLISLALRNDSVDVLNAGVVSYSPLLHYLKLKYLIEKENLDFQKIFVFIDITDLQDELDYDGYEPYPVPQNRLKNFINQYLNQHSASSIIFRKIKKKYSTNIEWDTQKVHISHIDYLQRDFWTSLDYPWNKWAHFGADLATNNMKKIVGLCNDKNIQIKIVIFPHPYQISQHVLIDRNVRIWTKFAYDNNVELINLYPDFFNEDSDSIIKNCFIPDDVHWNDLGHMIVARRILDDIIQE